MVSKILTINKQNGLDVKLAMNLVTVCRPFEAGVALKFNQNEYNLKSVLGIVSAAVKFGDIVEFICRGKEADAALQAILEVVES